MPYVIPGDPLRRRVPRKAERTFDSDLKRTLKTTVQDVLELKSQLDSVKQQAAELAQEEAEEEGATVDDEEVSDAVKDAIKEFAERDFTFGIYPSTILREGIVFGTEKAELRRNAEIDVRGRVVAPNFFAQGFGSSQQIQIAQVGDEPVAIGSEAAGIMNIDAQDIRTNAEYITPERPYELNLGRPDRKLLSIHAAELWIDTLVAQETRATIGGKIFVGPTSSLVDTVSGDIDDSAIQPAVDYYNYIRTKHNSFKYNDVIMMEARGRVEFMRIKSILVIKKTVYSSNGLRTFTGLQGALPSDGWAVRVREDNSAWVLTIDESAASFGDLGIDEGPATSDTPAIVYWSVDRSTIDGTDEDTILYGYWVKQRERIPLTTGGSVDDYVDIEPTVTVEDGFDSENPFEFNGGLYRFNVERDLDGTGANYWFEGDGVISTGQKNSGFIELFAQESMRHDGMVSGPTITFSVRDADKTDAPDDVDSSYYNHWTPRAAIGRLNGMYDYPATTSVGDKAIWGFAAGVSSGLGKQDLSDSPLDYEIEESKTVWIAADTEKGFRINEHGWAAPASYMDDGPPGWRNFTVGQWNPKGLGIGKRIPVEGGQSIFDGLNEDGEQIESGYVHPIEATSDGDLTIYGTLRLPSGDDNNKYDRPIRWRGTYDPENHYFPNDAVYHSEDDASYICEIEHGKFGSGYDGNDVDLDNYTPYQEPDADDIPNFLPGSPPPPPPDLTDAEKLEVFLYQNISSDHPEVPDTGDSETLMSIREEVAVAKNPPDYIERELEEGERVYWKEYAWPRRRVYLSTDGPRVIKNTDSTRQVQPVILVAGRQVDTEVYTGGEFAIVKEDDIPAATSSSGNPEYRYDIVYDPTSDENIPAINADASTRLETQIVGQAALLLVPIESQAFSELSSGTIEESSPNAAIRTAAVDTMDILDVTDGLGGGYIESDNGMTFTLQNGNWLGASRSPDYTDTDGNQLPYYTVTGVFYPQGETNNPDKEDLDIVIYDVNKSSPEETTFDIQIIQSNDNESDQIEPEYINISHPEGNLNEQGSPKKTLEFSIAFTYTDPNTKHTTVVEEQFSFNVVERPRLTLTTVDGNTIRNSNPGRKIRLQALRATEDEPTVVDSSIFAVIYDDTTKSPTEYLYAGDLKGGSVEFTASNIGGQATCYLVNSSAIDTVNPSDHSKLGNANDSDLVDLAESSIDTIDLLDITDGLGGGVIETPAGKNAVYDEGSWNPEVIDQVGARDPETNKKKPGMYALAKFWDPGDRGDSPSVVTRIEAEVDVDGDQTRIYPKRRFTTPGDRRDDIEANILVNGSAISFGGEGNPDKTFHDTTQFTVEVTYTYTAESGETQVMSTVEQFSLYKTPDPPQFISYVFKRASSQPSTPSGGTFTNPVPDDWSDGPPSGSKPLWMSQAVFKFGQEPNWSDPVRLDGEDGPPGDDGANAGIWTIWHPQNDGSAPSAPGGKPSDPPGASFSAPDPWTDEGNHNSYWMATSTYDGSSWSEWDVVKVKGEKGDSADLEFLSDKGERAAVARDLDSDLAEGESYKGIAIGKAGDSSNSIIGILDELDGDADDDDDQNERWAIYMDQDGDFYAASPNDNGNERFQIDTKYIRSSGNSPSLRMVVGNPDGNNNDYLEWYKGELNIEMRQTNSGMIIGDKPGTYIELDPNDPSIKLYKNDELRVIITGSDNPPAVNEETQMFFGNSSFIVPS